MFNKIRTYIKKTGLTFALEDARQEMDNYRGFINDIGQGGGVSKNDLDEAGVVYRKMSTTVEMLEEQLTKK